MKQKGFAQVFVLIALLVAVVLVLVISIKQSPPSRPNYSPPNNKHSVSKNDNAPKGKTLKEVKVVDPPGYKDDETFTVSGKVQEIKPIPDLLTETATPGAHYYEAGVYTSGIYTGYKRLIVTKDPNGPGGPSGFILATNDNQNYIFNLDGRSLSDFKGEISTFPDSDSSYNLGGFNLKKISAVTTLPPAIPKIFSLDDRYGMLKDSLQTHYYDTKEEDDLGNNIWEWQLDTNLSQHGSLLTPSTGFLFYAKPFSSKDWESYKGEEKTTRENYFVSSTTVYVPDPTGLVYSYKVGLLTSVKSYDQDYTNYIKGNYDLTKYPTISYHFKKTEINQGGPYFDNYSVAFPHNCALGESTIVIKNVSANDFKETGSWNNIPLFTLKDPNHRLNWLEWQVKISSIEDEYFPNVNKGIKKPTYQEYIGKNPLLFFKDYWNRWVAVGEFDYKLMGGCGKPVIYLYPPRPTEVMVRFLNPINFSVDIPRYKNGWKVLAYPDGTLTDLQPKLTDCSILANLLGTEYAINACYKNSYPYLYWAGQVVGQPYPAVTSGGWIIRRDEVITFLDSKLTEVGLTQKEKDDMEEYWVPKMLSHPEPYFRISFLTTPQMNEIVPMMINPVPDSVYRIFLDFLPLDDPGDMATIKPQVLPRVVRNGFTLVEWGGLNR